jgi:predicted Zn-dependent protease
MRNASFSEVRTRFGIRYLQIILVISLFSVVCQGAETGKPPRYYADLAEVHGRYGDHARSCEMYRKAIDEESSADAILEYRSALADQCVAAGDAHAAREILRDLSGGRDVALAASAQIRLAKMESDAGKIDDAIDRLSDVAGECPIHELRRSALLVLVQLAGSNSRAGDVVMVLSQRLATESGVSDLLDIAMRLATSQARVELAAAAVDAHPDDFMLRQRYAEALIETLRYDEAVEAYRTLAQEIPDLEKEACEGLARIASLRQDLPGLIAAVQQAASAMPDDIHRDLYFSRIYAELGAWEQAAEAARAACARAGAVGPAMASATAMELGEALVHLGQMEEARKLLAPIAAQTTWHDLQARAKQQLAIAENRTDL